MAIDVRGRLGISDQALAAFCRKWKITELAIFGSALGDDFRPDSDIDLLVTFAPDARWSLFDLVGMEDDATERLGRQVDLIEKSAVERSENYVRRRNILAAATIIYAV